MNDNHHHGEHRTHLQKDPGRLMNAMHHSQLEQEPRASLALPKPLRLGTSLRIENITL